MNAAFILQVLAIFVGGGTVQLIIFLMRRRPELRKLDAESDATLLDSANVYIGTLLSGEKALRGEIADLKTELRLMKEERVKERMEWMGERDALRREWDTERMANTEALDLSTREITRVRLQLLQVRSDLAGALVEISDLKTRLGSDS